MTDCLKKKPHRGGNEKNNFLLLEPELAKEWHPTKNIWEPQELTAKSGQKVWWQCLKNPSHEWEQTLHNRSRKRSGCPYCPSGNGTCRLVDENNNLAVKFPLVADEWHPTLNGDLRPQDVLPGTERRAWWQCRTNSSHTWQALVFNRTKPNRPSGCPICMESQGEKMVAAALDELGIHYEREKVLPDCRYKGDLFFDFYLPDHNAVIEFHGSQHYKPEPFYGGEEGFRIRKIRDNIKEHYCEDNDIAFLEIPYPQYWCVPAMVSKFMNKINPIA